MESKVTVTRRGQTTIPIEIREKCDIKEGDRLLVSLTENGILFKPIPKLETMAGIDAAYASPQEVNKKISKLREEY
jgi:AbrB family looped-hinge helix DNA binding protein